MYESLKSNLIQIPKYLMLSPNNLGPEMQPSMKRFTNHRCLKMCQFKIILLIIGKFHTDRLSMPPCEDRYLRAELTTHAVFQRFAGRVKCTAPCKQSLFLRDICFVLSQKREKRLCALAGECTEDAMQCK